jgi:hypothetical protein
VFVDVQGYDCGFEAEESEGSGESDGAGHSELNCGFSFVLVLGRSSGSNELTRNKCTIDLGVAQRLDAEWQKVTLIDCPDAVVTSNFDNHYLAPSELIEPLDVRGHLPAPMRLKPRFQATRIVS